MIESAPLTISAEAAPPRTALARRRRGFTLAELVAVLVVAGVLLALGVPRGRAVLDRIAVTSAREELIGLVHRVRAVAAASAGATLRVDTDAESITLVGSGGDEAGRLVLADRGIDLSTPGSSAVVVMTWNALGWGVVSSRTLVLSRGHAEARVVVSSRGRATRR